MRTVLVLLLAILLSLTAGFAAVRSQLTAVALSLIGLVLLLAPLSAALG
jgi:hypothetical protein